MNTKLAVALLLLVSFAAGACVIEDRKNPIVGAPQLETELAELERVYTMGGMDEGQYYARREMLVTVWELRMRDQQQR